MKRATLDYDIERNHLTISIHALVKRATCNLYDSCVIVMYFNPRPREEGDLRVSVKSDFIDYFNPRPREEGDL